MESLSPYSVSFETELLDFLNGCILMKNNEGIREANNYKEVIFINTLGKKE